MLNDLGVDPYEWFDNPLDRMPIAKDEPLDLTPSSVEPQDFPPELLEIPTSVTNPKPPEKKEEETRKKVYETPHHIAYQIATAKYNPFAVGGSENIHDLGGGSETIQK
tara:strand:+ start:382 stop:705 length:324 start_codon:yes stop_codon:yes gene_type:complete